ncbi:GDSL-type esterase/lipase family protein [Parabacteroides sp. PF5-9]|uniref:GDSL-type esterase/lipase family protein n=1 Tax=Parabacteroides sp. PF5-9 TaxID=1742404 RepID=UPI002473B5D9|nr:GDSL-type esterase/lipase family protein [Parabacteroides sp. PF5-9]MDH6358761.1 lysophospholipase L1-like esterase [Parabacteroides sp. PF5-9]
MRKQRMPYISLSLLPVILAINFCLPQFVRGHIIHIPDSLPPITVQVNDSLCIITDSAYTLTPFFKELKALQDGKDTVISIIHLGDSHIQAGYFSGQVMRLLQDEFGNGGRGWIAPFKLSKTNEPDDYYINSVVRNWETGRIAQNKQKTAIGPGGIGIKTDAPSVNFELKITPVNGVGYSFNQVVFYRSKGSMPMLPAGPLKESVQVSLATDTCMDNILADTFRIHCLTDIFELHSTRRKRGTDELLPAADFDNIYYGFSLTNGGSGLLYHSIGVNGAMFVNYTDESYIRQLALLHPSLLIISLGTNETFGRRFTATEFTKQIDAFIALIKTHLPNTTLLFTTPPECFRRAYVNKKYTYVRNENIERAAKAIVNYARQHGIACWDMFAITGGKNSSKKWYDAELFSADRIHFRKEGYLQQGYLFNHALIKTYNQQLVLEKTATSVTGEEIQDSLQMVNDSIFAKKQ